MCSEISYFGGIFEVLSLTGRYSGMSTSIAGSKKTMRAAIEGLGFDWTTILVSPSKCRKTLKISHNHQRTFWRRERATYNKYQQIFIKNLHKGLAIWFPTFVVWFLRLRKSNCGARGGFGFNLSWGKPEFMRILGCKTFNYSIKCFFLIYLPLLTNLTI